MDTAGAEACRPFIEAASPEHPSLIDVGHRMAELFGVINIPNAVWIDEDGVIVRPAEPAHVAVRDRSARAAVPGLPERMQAILEEASKIKAEPERYLAALRDWAAKGANSEYALSPDEVVRRSRPRSGDAARGAAHFELAQHLWRAGDEEGAVEHFRAAHRLDPDNFSYKRQAWSLATPGLGPFERYWQGPVEGRPWPYESDWLTEVREKGAEAYYPPLEL